MSRINFSISPSLPLSFIPSEAYPDFIVILQPSTSKFFYSALDYSLAKFHAGEVCLEPLFLPGQVSRCLYFSVINDEIINVSEQRAFSSLSVDERVALLDLEVYVIMSFVRLINDLLLLLWIMNYT